MSNIYKICCCVYMASHCCRKTVEGASGATEQGGAKSKKSRNDRGCSGNQKQQKDHVDRISRQHQKQNDGGK